MTGEGVQGSLGFARIGTPIGGVSVAEQVVA
jgi:hypothetical protein